MYESIIVAMVLAILGGVANILYEKYFANADFVVTKELLIKRLGTAAFAGFLVFYGMAEPAETALNIAELVQDFGSPEFVSFATFATAMAGSGYFGDDIVDVALNKLKKKPKQDAI